MYVDRRILTKKYFAEICQQHVLYLNRSLCKIKLSKIEDALWDCDQVRSDFRQHLGNSVSGFSAHSDILCVFVF